MHLFPLIEIHLTLNWHNPKIAKNVPVNNSHLQLIRLCINILVSCTFFNDNVESNFSQESYSLWYAVTRRGIFPGKHLTITASHLCTSAICTEEDHTVWPKHTKNASSWLVYVRENSNKVECQNLAKLIKVFSWEAILTQPLKHQQ